MTNLTLGDVESRFDVAMLDYLDRQVSVPVVTTAACQGDVSILRATATGPATTPLPKAGVPVVVGESGGNTHSVHGTGFFDPAPVRGPRDLTLGTLTVPPGGEVFLLHPEHGGMQFAPGTYRIGRQREQADEIAYVVD